MELAFCLLSPSLRDRDQMFALGVKKLEFEKKIVRSVRPYTICRVVVVLVCDNLWCERPCSVSVKHESQVSKWLNSLLVQQQVVNRRLNAWDNISYGTRKVQYDYSKISDHPAPPDPRMNSPALIALSRSSSHCSMNFK